MALALTRTAWASPGEGTATGILARLPFGARGQALGGGHGGLPGAPEAFLANPAALARVESPAGTAAWDLGPEDVRYGGLAGGAPVLPWLAAGGTIRTFSAGTIEAHDYTGAVVSADLQSDVLVSAGAASRWGAAGYGATVKYYHSTVIGSASGGFASADLGADLKIDLEEPSGPPPWPAPAWAWFGAAIADLGGAARYSAGGVSDPAPTAYRLGAALGKTPAPGLTLLGTLDLAVPAATARLETSGGLEAARDVGEFTASVRAGFRARPGTGVLSAGLGAAWRGIRLDYAYVAADDPFGAAHHVSASFDLGTYRRGPPRPEP